MCAYQSLNFSRTTVDFLTKQLHNRKSVDWLQDRVAWMQLLCYCGRTFVRFILISGLTPLDSPPQISRPDRRMRYECYAKTEFHEINHVNLNFGAEMAVLLTWGLLLSTLVKCWDGTSVIIGLFPFLDTPEQLRANRCTHKRIES